MKRIGIDVGGTNTDAVIVVGGRVVRSVKSPTTPDVTSGIVAAIRKLGSESDSIADADAVMVGTTHFVNAVVQRRHLSQVAAVRIGLPATRGVPPFSDWPGELAGLVRGGAWMVEGGHDYDGRRFMPLNPREVIEAAREIRARGLRYIAVSAMFSPLDPSDETRVADILRDEIPGAEVVCSHSVGGIGLLERENAAILNASLMELAETTVRSFERAKAEIGISAPLYITQNDGTVAEAARAAAFPVFSFASGPTNSMRGAAYLSKLQDALVVDIGGTSSDFGFLRAGFPREANTAVKIGDVRTLFRMPDLISIGLGGGSLVDPDRMTVGPASVGYRLTEEALVFGGSQLTATDIGVAAGLLDIGDKSRVAHLQANLVRGVLNHAKVAFEDYLDRMKPDAGDVTFIAVGGGAFLVPDRVEGASRVVRVEHGDCANAVGAAIAQVSGEVDQVFQNISRAEAIATARQLANARAVEAGAGFDTLNLVEADDVPIAYLPGNAIRVRVKVVGDVRANESAPLKVPA
jgi:N-methylhydantoinase A/oxoprolinase/acetone carboxylase beta subunit